jgi:uncharacterized membrane protein
LDTLSPMSRKFTAYKGWARLVLAAFYVTAGINHFWHPEFYRPLIPDYLPWNNLINTFSGMVEVILGILVLPAVTRKIAAYSLIAMLVAFIPSHVYFIELGGCIPEGLCVPEWVGWVRLVIIHPFLMAWVWWVMD